MEADAVCRVWVTPDELGDSWSGGKAHQPLRATWNGRLVGQPNAGVEIVLNIPS